MEFYKKNAERSNFLQIILFLLDAITNRRRCSITAPAQAQTAFQPVGQIGLSPETQMDISFGPIGLIPISFSRAASYTLLITLFRGPLLSICVMFRTSWK